MNIEQAIKKIESWHDCYANRLATDCEVKECYKDLDMVIECITKEKETNGCDHSGGYQSKYDHGVCLDCGYISTDSGWGIASNKWFKSVSDAKFYQENGFIPK
ncbi:hypothetical protein NVP1243O_42 [Vibrio phage 1.243.O._10N.261.54.B5]|nr:hypothetical protein NVP1243O_42 [Vibrio phage 1.243.O._10N.261.54.B5]